jgi:hypothetical protein
MLRVSLLWCCPDQGTTQSYTFQRFHHRIWSKGTVELHLEVRSWQGEYRRAWHGSGRQNTGGRINCGATPHAHSRRSRGTLLTGEEGSAQPSLPILSTLSLLIRR